MPPFSLGGKEAEGLQGPGGVRSRARDALGGGGSLGRPGVSEPGSVQASQDLSHPKAPCAPFNDSHVV